MGHIHFDKLVKVSKKEAVREIIEIMKPTNTLCRLRKYDDSKYIDHRKYRSMIGSLLYVTSSRAYVMQEVGEVAGFQATPKESHVLVVKRIFRYLKGTKDFGLWYPKRKDISLIAYTYAYWEGFIDDSTKHKWSNILLG
jgi:hypothetical protein